MQPSPTKIDLSVAQRVSADAAEVGFDWNTAEEALLKVQEETGEVRAALAGDGDLEDEIGDLLFSVVNVARKGGIDAQDALSRAVLKFQSRFHRMNETLSERGISTEEASLDQMEEVWNEIKHL